MLHCLRRFTLPLFDLQGPPMRLVVDLLIDTLRPFRQRIVIALPILPIVGGAGPRLLPTGLASTPPCLPFQRIGTLLVTTAIEALAGQICTRVYLLLHHPPRYRVRQLHLSN